MQGHNIEKLDKINSLPMSKVHNKRFQYYCVKRQKYLCEGEGSGNTDYPVYSIPQLYEEYREANESVTVRQREKLEHLIRNAQLKKDEIYDNYTETMQFIEQQYQKAMSTLNQLYQDKLARIVSD